MNTQAPPPPRGAAHPVSLPLNASSLHSSLCPGTTCLRTQHLLPVGDLAGSLAQPPTQEQEGLWVFTHSLGCSQGHPPLWELTLPAGPSAALCVQVVPGLAASQGGGSRGESVLFSLCLAQDLSRGR